MGFKLKKVMHNGVPVLELHGRVSGGDTLKVSHKLEALSKKKFDKVIVDLSKIDFLDSSWLGIFIYSWKLFNEYKKQLIFLIPPGVILDIFRSARLDTTFTIIDSLDNL
ncbi:STAS domain-containing protein [Fibrobacterota bacterium]